MSCGHCESAYTCCNCGERGSPYGSCCAYCWSCNACDECYYDDDDDEGDE